MHIFDIRSKCIKYLNFIESTESFSLRAQQCIKACLLIKINYVLIKKNCHTGYSHRFGCTNRFDSRIDEIASYDGNIRNPNSNSSRSRTRANFVFHTVSQSLSVPGNK